MKDGDGVGTIPYATSQGTSPTIGFLTYGTRGTIASDIWSAVSDVAREREGNALRFRGGFPDERATVAAMSRVAFNLARGENGGGAGDMGRSDRAKW